MLNRTLYDNGNGGYNDVKSGNYSQTTTLGTLVYLALFRGNREGSTVRQTARGQYHYDYWGNDKDLNSSTWVNSETQRTLEGIVLNAKSVETIKRSVVKDTKHLKKYGNVDVFVSIPLRDRVEIRVTITEPSNQNNNELSIIWDASRNEIINIKEI